MKQSAGQCKWPTAILGLAVSGCQTVPSGRRTPAARRRWLRLSLALDLGALKLPFASDCTWPDTDFGAPKSQHHRIHSL